MHPRAALAFNHRASGALKHACIIHDPLLRSASGPAFNSASLRERFKSGPPEAPGNLVSQLPLLAPSRIAASSLFPKERRKKQHRLVFELSWSIPNSLTTLGIFIFRANLTILWTTPHNVSLRSLKKPCPQGPSFPTDSPCFYQQVPQDPSHLCMLDLCGLLAGPQPTWLSPPSAVLLTRL